jgi:hypothetical protein
VLACPEETEFTEVVKPGAGADITEVSMRNRFGALIVIALVQLVTGSAAGQVPANAIKAKAAKVWTPPHTPDGQPDLQGIWNSSTLTPLERPAELAGKGFLTAREAADYERSLLQSTNRDRRDGSAEDDLNRVYNDSWYDSGGKIVKTMRTSLVIDPPDGRIPPFTPEAQKRETARAEDRRRRGPDPADSWEDRSLGERCITRGAPKLPGGYNNNFQIVQTPGYVAILQEMIHEVRMIPLDGRPHVDKNIRQWLGDSRGHWEGNTLVVDTTNFTDKIASNAFNCCRGAGANLHVVERFTRVDTDTIDYQYTVDDPTTYTRRWTVAVPMSKVEGPIYEYACHEGNYGMANLLSGARAQEKAAAEIRNK